MKSTKIKLRICENLNKDKIKIMLYNVDAKRRGNGGAAVTPAEQYAMLNAENKEKVIFLIEKLRADELKSLPPLCVQK